MNPQGLPGLPACIALAWALSEQRWRVRPLPERKSEITALGLKAIPSSTLATLMTGAVVSVF